MGVKGEGIKKYPFVLQNSHEVVKYSIGNTVINILITVGGRWVRDLLG